MGISYLDFQPFFHHYFILNYTKNLTYFSKKIQYLFLKKTDRLNVCTFCIVTVSNKNLGELVKQDFKLKKNGY